MEISRKSGKKVSHLALKWCKISFCWILFQSEIWNMTSLDINNKWVCTCQRGTFASVEGSNSMPFWLNIIKIQEGTKTNSCTQKCTDPYIWRVMSLDVLGCWQIHTERVYKYNGILHHFNIRLETYLFFHLHKDSIVWKMSASQNSSWPWSPSLKCQLCKVFKSD